MTANRRTYLDEPVDGSWVCRSQPVIDQIVRVDHAGGLEPCPLFARPRQVGRRCAPDGSVGQRSNDGEKEFVRDGVLVMAGLLPPYTSAACARVPFGGDVREYRLGHCQIGLSARQVVGVTDAESNWRSESQLTRDRNSNQKPLMRFLPRTPCGRSSRFCRNHGGRPGGRGRSLREPTKMILARPLS